MNRQAQTLYLNNRGSRWIVTPREKVLVFCGADSYYKQRTIEFYEAFGNFAVACFRYNGKMIKRFVDEDNGKRVVFVNPTEKYKRVSEVHEEDSATERYYGN